MHRPGLSQIVSLAILLSLVAALVGCGGSGGPAADGNPAGGLGRLTLRISRAEAPGEVRVTAPGEVSLSVSSSTQTVVVFVEDLQSGDPVIPPVSVQLDSLSQQTVSVDQVPAGTWLLRLELFDSQNRLLAVGETQVTVLAGQVTSATVTLTPTSSPSPSPSPSASPTPARVFVYVANYLGNTLTRYESNADGSLTPLSPAVSRPGHNPHRLARDPSGSFLFVIHAGAKTIESFVVGTDGSLTSADVLTLAGSPTALKPHPTLNKLYVGLAGGELDTVNYDPGTGALSLAASGSPGQDISDLEPAPGGNFLFMILVPDGLVRVPLDAAGIPDLSSPSVVDGTLARTLLGHPGGFLYAGDTYSQAIRGFKDLDAAPSFFTSQTTSPLSPEGLALHPGGGALYACGSSSSGGAVLGFPLSSGSLGTSSSSPPQANTSFLAAAVRPAGDFGYVVGQSTVGEIFRFTLLDAAGQIGGLGKVGDTDDLPTDIEIFSK